MGSLTVVPVENRRVERYGRISSEWVAGVIPKAYIMDKHLENQAKSAQIPVHLNVLRNKAPSVPPPQVLGPVKMPKREANKVVPEMQQINTTVKSIFENVHKRKVTQQNKSCLDSRFQLI
jgi:hypothetical protein